MYPHILRIHQFWSTIPDLSEATALLFANLILGAAWYQNERGRTKESDEIFNPAHRIFEFSTNPDRDSQLANIYFFLGGIAMNTNDFDKSRYYKERTFDLVSKICKRSQAADERLYPAYTERAISCIQDKRYEEGEADLKKALRIRKNLGNCDPRSDEVNLGWVLLAQGKLGECNALLLDSLGREKELGKDDRQSVRTGLILYVLGNLRATQRQRDESFDYHLRAYKQMQETVGAEDPNTANAAYKVAEHLIDLDQNEDVMTFINTALNFWSLDPKTYKNEIARTTFLNGKMFEAMGRAQEAFIAFEHACSLRKEITKKDRRIEILTTEDFDEIVAFWAR